MCDPNERSPPQLVRTPRDNAPEMSPFFLVGEDTPMRSFSLRPFSLFVSVLHVDPPLQELFPFLYFGFFCFFFFFFWGP